MEDSLDGNSPLVEDDDIIVDFFQPNVVPIFSHPSLLPPRDQSYWCTFVLDLDETLVSADRGCLENYEIIARADSSWFLQQLKENGIETIIWSAGMEEHVRRSVDLLDPSGQLVSACISRHESWYQPRPVIKSLNLLKDRDPSDCLLIENNLETALGQSDRVIIVPAFTGQAEEVSVLKNLFSFIDESFIRQKQRSIPKMLERLTCYQYEHVVDCAQLQQDEQCLAKALDAIELVRSKPPCWMRCQRLSWMINYRVFRGGHARGTC